MYVCPAGGDGDGDGEGVGARAMDGDGADGNALQQAWTAQRHASVVEKEHFHVVHPLSLSSFLSPSSAPPA